MNLTFKGKTAVIAGACGGMGLTTAQMLLQNNIVSLMLDVNQPPQGFLHKYPNADYHQADLTDFAGLKRIIDNFYDQHRSIDYLVNTTGVLWFGKDVSVVDIDMEIWNKVFDINIKSMVYLSKLIAPRMVAGQFGAMVHISSIDEAEDIANGVMYLLSDWAKYVTGTQLIVDGGLTAKP